MFGERNTLPQRRHAETHRQDEQDQYNAENDFAKSIDEAYALIRERKANGGEGWEPK